MTQKKNKHILLVRHGESTANLDHYEYARRSDFNVPVTQFGHEQSIETGKFLENFLATNPELKGKKIRVYYSPYLRTRQTMDGMLEGAGKLFSKDNPNLQFREEPMLREQDYGVFMRIRDSKERRKHFPLESEHVASFKERGGPFYAQMPHGESLADTVNRVEVFKDKMMSSLDRNDIDVCIIIAHDGPLKCFEKAFFHHNIEWLDQPGRSMKNADIKLFHKEGDKPYTSEIIFENKQRTPHMPKDYKTQAFGEEKQSPAMAV